MRYGVGMFFDVPLSTYDVRVNLLLKEAKVESTQRPPVNIAEDPTSLVSSNLLLLLSFPPQCCLARAALFDTSKRGAGD